MCKSTVIFFLMVICVIVNAHQNYIPICPNLLSNIFADPSNCRNYIQCINGQALIYKCPLGTKFYPLIGKCDHRHYHRRRLIVQQRYIPMVFCPATFYGNIPHPTDCQKYLICNYGTVIQTMTCLYGALYNARTARCDSPINVPGCQNAIGNGINYRQDIGLVNGHIWNGYIHHERVGNFIKLWNVFNNNYQQRPVSEVMNDFNRPYFYGTNFPSGNIPQNYLPGGNFVVNGVSPDQTPINNNNIIPDDNLANNNFINNNIGHNPHMQNDVSYQKPEISNGDKDDSKITLDENEDDDDDAIEYPDIDIR